MGGESGGSVQEPELLYVSCRNCGASVPTEFRLTSAVYAIEAGVRYDLTCPRCGVVAPYTKADFHISTEAG